MFRSAACKALRAIGPDARAALPALAADLCNRDAEVADAAASVLSTLGHAAQGAMPILYHMLKSPDPVLRRRALAVLRDLGPASLPMLPAIKAMPPHFVKESQNLEAIMRIEPFTPKLLCIQAQSLLDPFTPNRTVVRQQLELWGPALMPAMPVLLKGLTHEDAGVRLDTAAVFRFVAPERKEPLDALAKLLREADPDIRYRAAEVLWLWGPKAAALDKELATVADTDPDPLTKLTAGLALGRLREK